MNDVDDVCVCFLLHFLDMRKEEEVEEESSSLSLLTDFLSLLSSLPRPVVGDDAALFPR